MDLDTRDVNAIDGEPALQKNEFRTSHLAPGQIILLHVDEERVAVYCVDGAFYATQDRCAHIGWPLTDGGELSGARVTCPMHGWCYDVTTGEVVRGMRSLKLKTYRVVIDGDIARVLENT